MTGLIEQSIASAWNRLTAHKAKVPGSGLLVGSAIEDGKSTHPVYISRTTRAPSTWQLAARPGRANRF
jgi:hypothetical protein